MTHMGGNVRHYFAWVNGRYRLIVLIGRRRLTIPWLRLRRRAL